MPASNLWENAVGQQVLAGETVKSQHHGLHGLKKARSCTNGHFIGRIVRFSELPAVLLDLDCAPKLNTTCPNNNLLTTEDYKTGELSPISFQYVSTKNAMPDLLGKGNPVCLRLYKEKNALFQHMLKKQGHNSVK